MPKRVLARTPDLHLIPTDRLFQVRRLAAQAADAVENPAKYASVIDTANAVLSKFERGYFIAWRDALALQNEARSWE